MTNHCWLKAWNIDTASARPYYHSGVVHRGRGAIPMVTEYGSRPCMCALLCWDRMRSWFLWTSMASAVILLLIAMLLMHDTWLIATHSNQGTEIARDRILLHSRLWHVLEPTTTNLDILRVVLVLLAAIGWVWLGMFLPVAMHGECRPCHRVPTYQAGLAMAASTVVAGGALFLLSAAAASLGLLCGDNTVVVVQNHSDETETALRQAMREQDAAAQQARAATAAMNNCTPSRSHTLTYDSRQRGYNKLRQSGSG